MRRLFHRCRQRGHTPIPTYWERKPRTPGSDEVFVDDAGRRHRADAPYLLPKDGQEMARLDYQHYLLRQVFKGNSFAPVPVGKLLSKASAVLDVGCGTGRWGMEIATSYPYAQVYGFDLEAPPHPLNVPSNAHFHQGNLLHGLPFASQSFDYVHQRLLVAAIPADRWVWVLRELHRVTRPGGWVELIEMGTTFRQAGPATTQFLQWWGQIAASRGIDASQVAHLDLLMLQAAPWELLTHKTFVVPVGSWGGRVGALLAQDILAGWPTMRPLAQSMLGVARETFDEVLTQLVEEWNSFRTSYEVYAFCGQVQDR